VAGALANLVNVVARRDGSAAATEFFDRALSAAIQAYGTPHPRVADLWETWGAANDRDGAYDDAAAAFGHAVAVNTALHGEEHYLTARNRIRLAHALRMGRDWDRAFTEYAALHEFLEESDVRQWYDVRVGMAWVHLGRGDSVLADSIARAVRSDIESGGPSDAGLERFLGNLEERLGTGAQ
jgi:hypothetical protein